MENGRCNVIYLDRRAPQSCLVKKDDLKEFLRSSIAEGKPNLDENGIMQQNLEALLATFNEGKTTVSSKSPTMLTLDKSMFVRKDSHA